MHAPYIANFSCTKNVNTIDTQFLSYMFWYSQCAIVMDGTYNINITNAQPTRNAVIFSKMSLYLNYMNIRTVWCAELHTIFYY
jgi:hypothetical protein